MAFSSHIIGHLRPSDLYQKTLIIGVKNGIRSNTRNLPGRRVSTSQADLDQTCYAFTAGKTEVKEGKLTIRNLRPVDSGLYQCVVTNSLGTKKATMNLVVTAGLYIARYADLIYHGQQKCKTFY